MKGAGAGARSVAGLGVGAGARSGAGAEAGAGAEICTYIDISPRIYILKHSQNIPPLLSECFLGHQHHISLSTILFFISSIPMLLPCRPSTLPYRTGYQW